MILSQNSSPIGKIPAVWEFSGWPHEQKEALLRTPHVVYLLLRIFAQLKILPTCNWHSAQRFWNFCTNPICAFVSCRFLNCETSFCGEQVPSQRFSLRRR